MLAEVKLPCTFFDDDAMLSGAEAMEMDLGGRYGRFSEISVRASVVVNVGCESGDILSFGDGGVFSEIATPIVDSTYVVSSMS
jgi:hypothetical protein